MSEKLAQTPSQTVGPFFHFALIEDGENILINEHTQGQVIRLVGTVYDGEGASIQDALIEIWQADAAGIFNSSEDPNHQKVDPNFKGFGRSDTRNKGQYCFDTVKPSNSSLDDNDQAPYIRLRVFARGMLVHATTRLYFSDEANQADPILSTVPASRRTTLIAKLERSQGVPTYRFDIYLQGDKETVFFEA